MKSLPETVVNIFKTVPGWIPQSQNIFALSFLLSVVHTLLFT